MESQKIFLNPNDPDQCMEIASKCVASEQYGEARKLLNLCLNLRPDWPLALAHLGFCLAKESGLERKTLNKAVEILEKSLALETDSSHTHFYLGYAKYRLQKYDSALESLASGISMDPNSVQAHLLMARILSEKEEFQEAKKMYNQVLEIDDGNEVALRELELINWLKKSTRIPGTFSSWPIPQSLYADLEIAARNFVVSGGEDGIGAFLNDETVTLTLGSCFARNLASALVELGFPATNFSIGEVVNSTYANRYFLDWVADDGDTDANDEVLEQIAVAVSAERNSAKEALRNANVIVYTLGVAPCFFDRDERFFLASGRKLGLAKLASEYNFRTTTVAENVNNIERIIARLRQFNPNAIIVFSVSPVPLSVSFEFNSPIVADCLSKSTLRVSIEEVMRNGHHGILYWPSFEIVRWLGSYIPDMYGEEDDGTTHVSARVVKIIMKLFLETYGSESIKGQLKDI